MKVVSHDMAIVACSERFKTQIHKCSFRTSTLGNRTTDRQATPSVMRTSEWTLAQRHKLAQKESKTRQKRDPVQTNRVWKPSNMYSTKMILPKACVEDLYGHVA